MVHATQCPRPHLKPKLQPKQMQNYEEIPSLMSICRTWSKKKDGWTTNKTRWNPNYLGLNYFTGFFLLRRNNDFIIQEVIQNEECLPKHLDT
jgi:hypothetical protein